MTDAAAAARSPEELIELANLAGRIATEVGLHIRQRRAVGVEVAASKSSINDIVTAADQEAERMVVAALLAARPEDGVVGEEGAGRQGTSGITWVVDPIDGTVNYLYDLAPYAVSIAATVSDETAYADGRRAVAGAVYLPRSEELFVARAGAGATLNGETITISGKQALETALVATGFGYTVERRTEQAEMFSRVIPRVRDMRRSGSAASDLCFVAAGRVDAYYERGLQPWDYAAGVLIATEAGAVVLGRDDSTRPGEPMMFVAHPALAAPLREVVLGA